MAKRAHSDVPTFPDHTGWSPKAGSKRYQVVNPSNPNCGKWYWKIQNGEKLAYFEYEDPETRAAAKKNYLKNSKAGNKSADAGHGKSSAEMVAKVDEVISLLKALSIKQDTIITALRTAGMLPDAEEFDEDENDEDDE